MATLRLIAVLLSGFWQLAAQTSTSPEIIVDRGHGKEVGSVALSPDGRYALSSAKSGSIILWETAGGRELHRIENCRCEQGNVAFSLDGKLALAAIWAGSSENYVQGWSVPDFQPVRTWKRKGIAPQTVAVSPVDGTLVTAGFDQKLRWALTFWDYASGRDLRSAAIRDQTNRVMFTPDARFVLVNSTFLDPATGHVANLAGTPYGKLEHLERGSSPAFSTDGKFVFIASYGAGELLETTTLAPKRLQSSKDCQIYSAAFARQGDHLLAGCSNGGLRLFDAVSGALLQSFAGLAIDLPRLSISRNGSRIFTGTTWWDLTSGSLGGILPVGESPVAVAVSPDGHLGATFRQGPVLWDLDKNALLAHMPSDSFFSDVQFPAEGKSVLISNGGKGAIIWDIAKGGVARVLTEVKSERIAVSPTEDYCLAVTSDKGAGLFSVATGQMLRTLVMPTSFPAIATFARPQFSADGKTAMVGNSRVIDVWDVASGRLLREFKAPYSISEGISPDGKMIVSSTTTGFLNVYSTATGKEVRTARSPLIFSAIAFTPDGRRFVTTGDDRTMRLWDAASGRELLRMIAFINGEWVAITPEGYYKASAKGDQDLSVRIGDRVYSIDQWRKTFYHPQVIDALLRTGDEGKALSSVLGNQLPPVTLSSPNLPTPPSIEVKSDPKSSGGTAELSFEVSDAKQPIDSVSIYVNGRQVTGGGDDNQPAAHSGPPKLNIPTGQKELALKIPVKLDPGENHVEIRASNGGVETSRGVTVFRDVSASVPETILPNLWILAIGVNHYSAPGLSSLNYAEADATAVAAEFGRQKGKLYREVHTLLISDSSAVKPTFDNIVDNLNYLKQAGQNDLVLLFVAGHGMGDDSGDFYFLPSDAAFQTDGSVRRSKAISWRELKSVLDVPARKIILLDACHSEGVTGRTTRSTGNDYLVRELRETRGVILSSSRGKELSQESPEWGHGAFTEALLKGMRGEADYSKNGKISMLALANYVLETVPVLTKGAQHPIIDTPEGYQQLEIVRLK